MNLNRLTGRTTISDARKRPPSLAPLCNHGKRQNREGGSRVETQAFKDVRIHAEIATARWRPELDSHDVHLYHR
jgi:hypothetical protein